MPVRAHLVAMWHLGGCEAHARAPRGAWDASVGALIAMRVALAAVVLPCMVCARLVVVMVVSVVTMLVRLDGAAITGVIIAARVIRMCGALLLTVCVGVVCSGMLVVAVLAAAVVLDRVAVVMLGVIAVPVVVVVLVAVLLMMVLVLMMLMLVRMMVMVSMVRVMLVMMVRVMLLSVEASALVVFAVLRLTCSVYAVTVLRAACRFCCCG